MAHRPSGHRRARAPLRPRDDACLRDRKARHRPRVLTEQFRRAPQRARWRGIAKVEPGRSGRLDRDCPTYRSRESNSSRRAEDSRSDRPRGANDDRLRVLKVPSRTPGGCRCSPGSRRRPCRSRCRRRRSTTPGVTAEVQCRRPGHLDRVLPDPLCSSPRTPGPAPRRRCTTRRPNTSLPSRTRPTTPRRRAEVVHLLRGGPDAALLAHDERMRVT